MSDWTYALYIIHRDNKMKLKQEVRQERYEERQKLNRPWDKSEMDIWTYHREIMEKRNAKIST